MRDRYLHAARTLADLEGAARGPKKQGGVASGATGNAAELAPQEWTAQCRLSGSTAMSKLSAEKRKELQKLAPGRTAKSTCPTSPKFGRFRWMP